MDDRLNIPSVTGTDLEFKVAGPGGRSYAFIIDWHIRLLVSFAWFIASSLLFYGSITWFDVGGEAMPQYIYLVVIPSLAIYFLYHPILEMSMDGRTPGKRIAGIRIVTRDGQVPGIGAHFIRNIFRLVDSLPLAYVIGVITTMMTENNVRFGDLAAGTLLIYDAADEKTALREVEATHGSRVGLQHAELMQELITRWDALEPQQRINLGRKLLGQLDVNLPDVSNEGQVLAQLKANLR